MMPAAQVASDASEERGSSTEHSDRAWRSRSGARSGVRISVDLRQFFADGRAQAVMWAPYRRCVQWLTRRVAREFGLPDDIALVSRGHVLPAGEPLLVLERDDAVQVITMSCLYTPHEQYEDIGVNSNKTTSGKTSVVDTVTTRMCPTQSNVIIKQKNGKELPTNGQGDNGTQNQNISRVSITEDEQITMKLQNGQNTEESEDLQRLKRRALRLLDEQCHMMHEASAPKRMRRRRRRRRQPAPAGTPNMSEDEGRPCGRGDSVLRNGPGSRPARLVRPLSPVPARDHAL